ncbi:MAG: flagellar biosynthetic protein FliR [Planctomycetaceae bacterium]
MIESLVITTVLVLFRVAAFVAFLPPLTGKNLPNTVKIGLVVALTALLAPQYAGVAALQLQSVSEGAAAWLQIGFLAARETVLGAAMSWLFGLFLVPARIAGAYIAQEMGLTIGQLASPTDDQPTNVLSQGLEALGVLLFFALNIHHMMFFALGKSFVTRPLLQDWTMPSWEAVLYSVTRVEHQAFLMIAPIGILLFVTSLTLLVTMRTAPQFNFMSYGMTLRLIGGMVAIALFLPELISTMRHFLQQAGTENWI